MEGAGVKTRKRRQAKLTLSKDDAKQGTEAGTSQPSNPDTGMDVPTGPVTRSKAPPEPRPLEPESESESESGGETCPVTTNSDKKSRIQQPNVYVLKNLMKVKMEVDYNPVIRVKQEDDETADDKYQDKEGEHRDSTRQENFTADKMRGNLQRKCLDSVISCLDKLHTTQIFGSLTYTQFLLIIREGRNRIQSKSDVGCSEDILCTAAISWLKHQSREKSRRVHALLEEFPENKYRGTILQALFNQSDSGLQKMAFALLLKLYNETDDSKNMTTETVKNPPETTETVKNPSESTETVKNLSETTETVKNPSESTETVKNPSETTETVKNPPKTTETVKHPPETTETVKNPPETTETVKNPPETTEIETPKNPLKKPPRLNPDDQQGSSCSGPKKNKKNVSESITIDEKKGNNKKESQPGSNGQIERTISLTPGSSQPQYLTVQRRPLLRITLAPKEISMSHTLLQNQKNTRLKIQNIPDLSLALENRQKDVKMSLHVSTLNLEGLQVFLRKFAHQISEFWWSTLEDRIPLSEFLKMLTKLPNLKHLHLDTVPYSWRIFPMGQKSSFSDAGLLQKIETISFRPGALFVCPEFLFSLLERTPNLQKIYNFSFLSFPQWHTNVHLLKFEQIKSVDLSELFLTNANDKLKEYLSNLAEISGKFKLEIVQIPLKPGDSKDWQIFWKSCCESFSRILENNKKSIEYLKIQPMVLPQLLVYPKMTAVKKICLVVPVDQVAYHCGQVVQFFEEQFDMSKKFPNLVEVNLEGINCALAKFLKFFPEDAQTPGYFKRVSTLSLTMRYFEELEALQKVAQFFPDVTTFSMDIIRLRWLEFYFVQVLQLWPKLTSLKLRLYVPCKHLSSRFPFDSVFTGIPSPKCDELRKSLEKKDLDVQEYRKSFAVSNMTELKELIIIFDGEYKQDEEIIPLFSHVTAFYGFQRLPDLQVTFAIPWDNKGSDKIREMLRPIEKHVNLIENYDELFDKYEKYLL